MVYVLRYKYLLELSVTGNPSECSIHCTHYSLADLRNTEISGFCLKIANRQIRNTFTCFKHHLCLLHFSRQPTC